MKRYEVLISKTAIIEVTATSKIKAMYEAQAILDGERGYSDYSNDGWEVMVGEAEEI